MQAQPDHGLGVAEHGEADDDHSGDGDHEESFRDEGGMTWLQQEYRERLPVSAAG